MRRWIPIAAASIAAVLDCAAAVAIDGWYEWRIGGALCAVTLATICALAPERLLGALPIRATLAILTATLLTLAVVDVIASTDEVLARGVLISLALLFTLATVLFHALRARPSDGRAARIAAGMLLATATTSIVLAFVEAAVVSVAPLALYDLVADDPDFGEAFTLGEDDAVLGRPGFRGTYRHPEFFGLRVELNGWGLRDREFEASRVAPNDDSVLVLGDSFAFGCGVEFDDTFQQRLETMQPRITNDRLRVTCAAVPGDGQTHEILTLDRFAARTRPDVVIVAFYCGNDFTDNVQSAFRDAVATGALNTELLPKKKDDSGPRLPRLLTAIQHPRFWFGGSALCAQLLPTVESKLVGAGWIDHPWSPVNGLLDKCLTREDSFERQFLREQAYQALGRLGERCTALGAAMIILVIPAAVQGSPAVYAEWLAHQPESRRGELDRRGFVDAFVRGLEQHGFPFIDSRPAIEADEAAGRSSYHHEGHWNANGHRIAAELLAPRIRAAFGGR